LNEHRNIAEAIDRALSHEDNIYSYHNIERNAMADDGDAANDATAASSPSSDANNNLEQEQDAASKSAKDRACPFCGQAFTSSSLGRHLDLYIKPKNPKPADGVHNVDEIRKLRGGITRRQPRNSMKGGSSRRDGSVETPDGTSRPNRLLKEASNAGRTNESTPAVSPVLAREGSGHGVFVNVPSWQSTGVINNIPPRAPPRPNVDASATGQAQRVQEMRRDTASGQPMQRPGDAQKAQEQAEIGRAAEMALREVLGSLQAARRKVEPGPIYEDFDFFAQSFPGLCLNILPPPTTLFSPAPFASPESWSLQPPGLQQSDVMNRLFNERCRDMRKSTPENPPDSVIFRHSAHLQGAFENWRLMSDKDQQAQWTLEALRCLTTSRDTNSKLKRRLADAEQHTSHLETQYERLSRCQLPREWLVRPPRTVSISESIAREMQKLPGGGLDSDYDPNTVISKWRETVRTVARPPRHSTAHMPNYAASAMQTSRYAGESLRDQMIMHGSLQGVQGPMRRTSDGDHLPVERSAATVYYETPPHPGAILDEDEQQPTTNSPQTYTYPYPPADADEDEDEDDGEDVSNVLDTSITNFVDRNALAKQKRFVQGSFSSTSPGAGVGVGTFGKFRINGSARQFETGSPVLNANGKRQAEMGLGGAAKGQRT
jgi:hypothetical protein